MPAQRSSTRAASSGGSFVEGSSSHNQHCFSSARDDLSRPYPSDRDVYRRSNIHNPNEDEFADVGLSDFFIAHRRVARRKLERLQLTPYQAGLLSRGVQVGMERREPYNAVLEAAMGYSGACSVAVMGGVGFGKGKGDKLGGGVGEGGVGGGGVKHGLTGWEREVNGERARAAESECVR